MARKSPRTSPKPKKRVSAAPPPSDSHELVILTGMSGSGKLSALKAFEDHNLTTVEFDPEKLATSGAGVSVVQDVLMHPGSGSSQYDPSHNGTLVYVTGGKQATENRLVLAEHDAKEQQFPVKPNIYEAPRFSPDGKMLALTVRLPDTDVWVYDLERGAMRRITFAPGVDELGIWSPDGKRIAYASNGRQQAFVLPVDGSSPERR